MADVTLTIALSDLEAHALAIVAASLGPEQFEHAYQYWLNYWKATEAYSPQVEANMIDLMGEAASVSSPRRFRQDQETPPTVPILDRLTAVGAARLVLANGHRGERRSVCRQILRAGGKSSPS